MRSVFAFEGDGLEPLELESINARTGLPVSEQITPEFDLTAALHFGKGSGVKVSGGITTTFIFDPDGPTTLSIQNRYDDQFYLSVWGYLDGNRFPPEAESAVQLVPFGGLSQFQAGAVALLEYAANQLVKLYNDYADTHPGAPVIVIVGNIMKVLNFFGVTSVATLYSTFQEVAADPMQWLLSFFEEPGIRDTLAQINYLMGPEALNLPGFSHETGSSILVYTPDIPVGGFGSLVVNLGDREGVFGVWVAPKVERGYASLSAEAGIGFKQPLQDGKLQFSMQVGTGVAGSELPPQMPGAPILVFGLNVGTADALEYYLRFFPLGEGEAKTDMLVALLPSPYMAYGDAPGDPVPATEWLLTFTTYFMVPILADIVLQTEQVSKWLNEPVLAPPAESPPPGPILADWDCSRRRTKSPTRCFFCTTSARCSPKTACGCPRRKSSSDCSWWCSKPCRACESFPLAKTAAFTSRPKALAKIPTMGCGCRSRTSKSSARRRTATIPKAR